MDTVSTEHLFRVAGVLTATAIIHKVHTPPTSATSVLAKKAPFTTAGDKFFRHTIPYFGILKAAAWVVAIAEIILILSPSILEGTTILGTVSGSHVSLRATAFSKISLFLILIGGSIRFWCYRILEKFHTFQLCIVEGHRLITTGPYSVVRHPSYSTAYLVYPGMACWYLAPGSIFVEFGGLNTFVGKCISAMFLTYVVGTCVAFFGRIIEEDRMLKEEFGAEWDQWARLVPCVLFPGVY